MGKIRVQDLARMMGISHQDLVFKLKSIGVRVEGDDAAIDTDIIQAILQGKKLPHPREVILRDAPVPAEPSRRRTTAPPPPPARRPTANPLRPNRPRTLIQKVEPRIQTLPASERQMPLSHGLSDEMTESFLLDGEEGTPIAVEELELAAESLAEASPPADSLTEAAPPVAAAPSATPAVVA